MATLLFSSICLSALFALGSAQFGFGFDDSDCALGKLLDPTLARALKSKFPKKYNSKLAFDKDSVLEAKYKAAIGKLLARRLKNLNSASCNLQSLMYEQPQSAMSVAQSFASPLQSPVLTQNQPSPVCQMPCDALRAMSISMAGQAPQFSRNVNPNLQASIIQQPGALSLTSLHPQQIVFPVQSAFSHLQQ